MGLYVPCIFCPNFLFFWSENGEGSLICVLHGIIAWQLVHINAGFGDYTGWYFDKNGALVVGSSEFNGWLGEFIPCPSSFLLK